MIESYHQETNTPESQMDSQKANNKNTQGGWISNRYCTYPQEIFIQFPTMVNIRQINVLINESKIPKMIEFINCIPVGEKNKFIIIIYSFHNNTLYNHL